MFRFAVSLCRIGAKNKTLNVVRDNVIFTSSRMSSNTVTEADEKAKDEAKKALYEVTSVIGKLEYSIGFHEPKYDEEYIKRFVDFFNRKNIDSWEIRRAIHDLIDYDAVPDPEIICACLKACRRLNDYALAVRVLEVAKDKCGNSVKEFYPYILQEIRPTLAELGLETIEELGYDKPELAVKDVFDIH